MRLLSRISNGVSGLMKRVVDDVPCAEQACESCRVVYCDAEQARQCLDRRCGEAQERLRRNAVVVNVAADVGVVPVSVRWRKTHQLTVPGNASATGNTEHSTSVEPSRCEGSGCRECSPPSSSRS